MIYTWVYEGYQVLEIETKKTVILGYFKGVDMLMLMIQ